MSTSNYPPGGTWEIDNGWDVVTSDGEKLGEVEEVHPHYLVVGKGMLFHKEKYVPVSNITDVSDNTVTLSASKSQVEREGWDSIPDMADTTSTTGMMDSGRKQKQTKQTMDTRGSREVDTSGTGDIEVPVMEEELDVSKRQVDRGSVRVHKDVVEREEQITVPVREESIRVTRHDVTGQDRDQVGDHAFEEEDIEIPLRGEEVEVSKHSKVTEHVHIGKDVKEHDEQASGTVRREQVRVDGEDMTERGDRP